MYENKNKHYAINVFSERNVRNVIFRFVFTCFNWFPIVHVGFITETSQILVTTFLI